VRLEEIRKRTDPNAAYPPCDTFKE